MQAFNEAKNSASESVSSLKELRGGPVIYPTASKDLQKILFAKNSLKTGMYNLIDKQKNVSGFNRNPK